MKKSGFLGIIGMAAVAALVLGLLVAGCGSGPKAAVSTPEKDFKTEVKDGAVTITGYTGSAKNVTIPGAIGGLPVTAVGEEAFAEKQLTGVTIPDSVATIGVQAFYKNKLTSVAIPGSVTKIGAHAFRENQLTSVTIPDSVTEIGEAAFYENQLANVTIPGSVTEIGKTVFQNNQLSSGTIP
jgi:hypothetical protein